jgi:hypothetical protein
MGQISSPRQIIFFWAYVLAKGKNDLTDPKALNLEMPKKINV